MLNPEIPLLKEINDLLQYIEAGFEARSPDFHINRFEDITDIEVATSRGAHRTDFYGIVLLEHGSGKISINDKDGDFTSGLLAFTSPGQVITWERSGPTKGFMLFFKPSLLQFGNFQSVSSQYPFFEIDANTLLIIGKEAIRFKKIFTELLEEYKGAGLQNPDIICAYLHLLLSLFKRLYFENVQKGNGSNNRKIQISSGFETLVRQNLPERKSLKWYAESLFISEKHLAEIIKETRGKTPLEYINDLFLQEARTLMLHTPYSIAEISYRLNFQDPSYFNKVFKKHFGVTPLAFKKEKVK